MQFLEWKYQIVYQIIPKHLLTKGKIQTEDFNLITENQRLNAYEELSFQKYMIKSGNLAVFEDLLYL